MLKLSSNYVKLPCDKLLVVKQIITSKSHTSQAIHSCSEEWPARLQHENQPGPTPIISAQCVFRTHGFASCAIRTLACYWNSYSDSFWKSQNITQASTWKKRNTRINGVCLSQKLCFDPRNHYTFVNKHTCAHTHKNKR